MGVVGLNGHLSLQRSISWNEASEVPLLTYAVDTSIASAVSLVSRKRVMLLHFDFYTIPCQHHPSPPFSLLRRLYLSVHSGPASAPCCRGEAPWPHRFPITRAAERTMAPNERPCPRSRPSSLVTSKPADQPTEQGAT